jgi:hypothetical protein
MGAYASPFGRRIIGVMGSKISIPKKGFRRLPQLSVGMHKIDLFLFPDVSKYQKVIEIADCIPETDS